MKKYTYFKTMLVCIFFLNSYSAFCQSKEKVTKLKELAVIEVENLNEELINISDSIWHFAELKFEEKKSSNLLIHTLKNAGFEIQENVGGLPTGFVATFGNEKPVIGIIGEFDALPGISQKDLPKKEPLIKGENGHACGHNLFAAGSLGGALAIKKLISEGRIKGTVKFFGTPAEEGGGGKIYMIQAGAFNGLDFCFDWHPAQETKAHVQPSQAATTLEIEYFGKSAHAGLFPWKGKSAQDAMELFADGVNLLREHVQPTARMQYTFRESGKANNIVPDYAKVSITLREATFESLQYIKGRIEKIAEGASLMADVDYRIDDNFVTNHQWVNNRTGGQLVHDNLEILGAISFSESEITYAKMMQKNMNLPEVGFKNEIRKMEETKSTPMRGGSDVGDVSWNVPEISFVVTALPDKVPMHSWGMVACGGNSIGHKSLIYASKVLAMTMIDLYTNEENQENVRMEYEERRGNAPYVPLVPKLEDQLNRIKK
jgi:aminobenzoyl-glutamate utilization protein B